MDYRITGIVATRLGSITYICTHKSRPKDKGKYCLRFQSDWSKYDDICQYLVDHYGDKIHEFTLADEMVSSFTEWCPPKKDKKSKIRKFGIHECELSIPITYQNQEFTIDIVVRIMRDHN